MVPVTLPHQRGARAYIGSDYDGSMSGEISASRVASTYTLIRPYIRRTPLLEVDGSDFGLDGVPLVLKLESLQHPDPSRHGAPSPTCSCAMSRGGRGRGLRRQPWNRCGLRRDEAEEAGQNLCPGSGVANQVRTHPEYGADLVVTGERYADALATSEKWAARSGALVVHAYDQFETLLGQATVGLEFEEQYPQLDSLVVAVGGGGLIGGIAAWYA